MKGAATHMNKSSNYYRNDNSRIANQTNNSPKSRSQLEIYKQTRNTVEM